MFGNPRQSARTEVQIVFYGFWIKTIRWPISAGTRTKDVRAFCCSAPSVSDYPPPLHPNTGFPARKRRGIVSFQIPRILPENQGGGVDFAFHYDFAKLQFGVGTPPSS